ncbi:MAG: hypothetical protein ACOVOQ_08955 [Flavobacterium sp.]
MKTILIYLTLLFTNLVLSQNHVNNKSERNKFNISLIENNNHNITSKKINKNEKFEGLFLGKIKVDNNKEYYIVSSTYFFNLESSPTAESHIFIYNTEKQYVGYYYLTSTIERPTKLFNNKLHFNNNKCNKKTKINFSNGIPRLLKINCLDESSYYEFKS